MTVDKPTRTYTECINAAGAIIAAELIRIERGRLMAELASESEVVQETGNPTRKPHNSPQSTPIEQIQTDPKPA
ncbi:hypothetical protein E3T61_18405 [Cryobacterium lactosi]|uniref:Uncharacterized protein n=1 Tax=Cryobacterium lactosi TaxID=1259202 RepID=A0A4R9BHN5_9MICO|nr:hypothetical protein [Cryobacterium lactosi]TFD84993.1 hypothetical protein E3T61_18405 [Cryobacterium lactosi]